MAVVWNVLLFAFFYVGGVSAEMPELCHGFLEKNCPKIHFNNALEVVKSLSLNEKAFQDNCRDLVAYADCISIFHKICHVPNDLFNPFGVVDQQIAFVRNVCNEQPAIRKKYVELAECVYSNAQGIMNFLKDSYKNVSQFWKINAPKLSASPLQELLKTLNCIQLRNVKSTAMTFFKSHCSEDAMEVFKITLGHILKPAALFCPQSSVPSEVVNPDKGLFEKFSHMYDDFTSTATSHSS